MPNLAFLSSWSQEVELTRCRISPSCLLGPKMSRLRDAKSRLLVFLEPRSRGDEMPNLAFLSSWTQEVELTRCRISPSVFLDPRSRGDEMPDLAFLSSWTQEVELTRCRISTFLSSWNQEVEVDEMPDLTFLSSWTQEVEVTRCRISPSCLLGPKKSS